VLIERGRAMCREHTLAEYSRWHDALRKVHKALPALRARWEARPISSWCHGDLHPGNVLRRKFGEGEQLAAGGLALSPPCVLIDLALVHPGHWMEDALYFERQFWGHADKLGGVKPVSVIAAMRRAAGLTTDEHYDQLANARRVLMAACAPAMMQREGSPRYLHTALEMIEVLLPQVPH
jgi:aminoglycoside phosphotransferase (APT) family kinase protein